MIQTNYNTQFYTKSNLTDSMLNESILNNIDIIIQSESTNSNQNG